MSIELNSAQQTAVDHDTGPMLVVAGAGTGKTRVIVERIAKLIEKGVAKQQILALTFTDKAAQEMLDRVSDRLQQSYGVEIPIFTFNAFGQTLLQEFAVEIGLSSNLKLLGDTSKIVLLREHLDDLDLDYFAPISRPDGQLSAIADYFSLLKQQLVSPEAYYAYVDSMAAVSDEDRLEKRRHSELAAAFKAYLAICKTRNVIDYDDQLYLLIELMQKRPNIQRLLQERYRYILVDEFQDTNPMQSKLIDLLVNRERNVFAVGDDDQSIYGWRGATLANILDFTNRYPEAKETTLIENYRSTQQILDGAWRLIQHNNPHRLEAINNLDKRLRAHEGQGEAPIVMCFSRLDAELQWVAEDIKRLIESGEDPGSFAILARGKATVEKVHQMLEVKGVEHTVAGITQDLYRQTVITMLIETCKALVDPQDSTALYHTLLSPLFNCDVRTISDAASIARSRHETLEEVLVTEYTESLSEPLQQIKKWRQLLGSRSVREVVYTILTESGYKESLYKLAQNDAKAAITLQTIGQWFSTLYDFEQIALVPSTAAYLENFDALRSEGETISDDTVSITATLPAVMTIHKSKGLEWKHVYVVDCTERSFPLIHRSSSLKVPAQLSLTSAADEHIQEERRLMYVAATRAQKRLVLSYSTSHNGATIRKPSRFIAEMCSEDQTVISQEELTGVELLSNDTLQRVIKLPESLKQNGHIVLTASKADDYLRCPRNFYYKHVLQVPEAPSAATEVGSLFHTVIQRINEARLHEETPLSIDEGLQLLNDGWPQAGFSSRKQRERALQYAQKAFTNLHSRLLNDPIPKAVEAPFRVHIPESKLILKGRIDAVLESEKGVEIRDYKTSTTVLTDEKAKEKTRASNQLTMYGVAWRLLHGEEPAIVSLDFVQTGHLGTVKKQSKSYDSMEQKLRTIADDILAGKFPLGQRHEMCIHPL